MFMVEYIVFVTRVKIAHMKNCLLIIQYSSRINDIPEDLCDQLISSLRTSKLSIQVDEATDVATDGNLIAYIRYIAKTNIIKGTGCVAKVIKHALHSALEVSLPRASVKSDR